MKGPLAQLLAKMKCLKESSVIFSDLSTSPKVPRPKWQAAGSREKLGVLWQLGQVLQAQGSASADQ